LKSKKKASISLKTHSLFLTVYLSCRFNKSQASTKVTSIFQITSGNEASLKANLDAFGPITVAIDALNMNMNGDMNIWDMKLFSFILLFFGPKKFLNSPDQLKHGITVKVQNIISSTIHCEKHMFHI
jgi:hypothetical protein